MLAGARYLVFGHISTMGFVYTCEEAKTELVKLARKNNTSNLSRFIKLRICQEKISDRFTHENNFISGEFFRIKLLNHLDDARAKKNYQIKLARIK